MLAGSRPQGRAALRGVRVDLRSVYVLHQARRRQVFRGSRTVAPGAGVRADAFIALKSRAEAEKLAESIKTLAATVFDGRAKPCHTP